MNMYGCRTIRPGDSEFMAMSANITPPDPPRKNIPSPYGDMVGRSMSRHEDSNKLR